MHPFSLNKEEQKSVTGGAFPGGCILTHVKGENGDLIEVIKF